MKENVPTLPHVQQDKNFDSLLKGTSILVIDDEPEMRKFLAKILEQRCKTVTFASDVKEASNRLDEQYFDIVVLDNVMSGTSGVDWLTEQRDLGLFSDVILITAYADLSTAIQALRAGASDFVLKPFRANQLLNSIGHCLDRSQLKRENYVLRYELESANEQSLLRSRLIGRSPQIEKVREMLARVAPLNTSILITGESGTGKEVAARSLHALSDRSKKPFVPVNCAAIPAEMVEAELFGHLKGAFTGAVEKRGGLFMHADGGTLFLDEVGELPLGMQSKLLRVIEDRRVRPVGSAREIPVDIRLVLATNVDLEEEVRQGNFREDLYYRINVVNIHMPSLRERGNDVQDLASLFMEKLARQLKLQPVAIDGRVRSGLATHDWPGNVRELRNLIERALILGGFPEDFLGDEHHDHGEGAPGRSLSEVEKYHILSVLDETGGNRAEAARLLGVSRKTIDRKCAMWKL